VAEQHRSIGEVLALLREEFPDVTISKIRFLESQGLVDPERTPSGYRRFYDRDIERLRWILRQQREHYLPLKVIKDRLDGLDPTVGPVGAPAGGAGLEPPTIVPEVARPEPSPALAAERPEPVPVAPVTLDLTDRSGPRVLPEPTIFASRPKPAPVTAGEPPTDDGAARRAPAAEDLSSISLTAKELAESTGMQVADLDELERYGLLQHRLAGNTAIYDGDALVIARLVAGFRAHGIEARHLRMVKVAADREAALFEQVVLPMARQRNPEVRRQVQETLTDLSRLTDSLHALLLRAALRTLG
jgi:DNA-binding transcriptional MerR regulator